LLHDGPLTSNGLECTAFVQTGVRPDLAGAPDLQTHAFSASPTHRDFKNLGFKGELIPEYIKRGEERHSTLFLVILLHARSAGSITLASADPFDPPIIQPNYLSHPDDVKTLVEIVERLAQSRSTQPRVFG